MALAHQMAEKPLWCCTGRICQKSCRIAGESHSWRGVSQEALYYKPPVAGYQEKFLAAGHHTLKKRSDEETTCLSLEKLPSTEASLTQNTRNRKQSLFFLQYLWRPLLTKLSTTCQLVKDKYLKGPNPFCRAGKKDTFETEMQ